MAPARGGGRGDPPGIYNVSGEMKGFKRVSIARVRLNVDQKARVELKLDVGDITESVQVQAAVPLVQTDSSELGTTVNETWAFRPRASDRASRIFRNDTPKRRRQKRRRSAPLDRRHGKQNVRRSGWGISNWRSGEIFGSSAILMQSA